MKIIFIRLSALLLAVGICLCQVTVIFAQSAHRLSTKQIEKRENYFSYQSARVTAQQPYVVQPGFTFTSVVLQINPAHDFTGAFIISENDTLFLRADEHQPQELEKKQSGLVVFAHPVKEFLFYPGKISDDVIFNFLNAGEITIKDKHLRTSREAHDPCAVPQAISQKVWRKGLPAPNYSRSFHEVNHIIVHHAASSNDLTDYTNVVRNIYLFHTETNGWSDIGYNYLIAQDGTIYEGRDPGSGEQDNVRGAHFCGKNTGTMGICLLGTYTDVAPTDTTVASLLKLMSWKVKKDNLDPLDFAPHPANSRLGIIAGHRDGCATLCPGDKVYAKMQEFKEFTDLFVKAACNDPVTNVEDDLAENPLKIYPVPANDEIHLTTDRPGQIQKIMLYDRMGRTIKVVSSAHQGKISIATAHLSAGIYILKVVFKNEILERKVVVR